MKLNKNFSLASRFKTLSGDYILVPQYVSDDFMRYDNAFGSLDFQSLTKQRDQFGWSIESRVSEAVGEIVEYAGEFGGVIELEGRLIIGLDGEIEIGVGKNV